MVQVLIYGLHISVQEGSLSWEAGSEARLLARTIATASIIMLGGSNV